MSLAAKPQQDLVSLTFNGVAFLVLLGVLSWIAFDTWGPAAQQRRQAAAAELQDLHETHSEWARTEGVILVGRAGNVSIYRDSKTGCEYLTTEGRRSRSGLVPRVERLSDGTDRQICSKDST